jgi:hypothetical protein
MKPAILLLILFSWPSWWRETNSHAASARGAAAYQKQQYAASAAEYQRAQKIAPSSRGAFNAGTADIAAGQRAQGAAELAKAMRDPGLRADALFNRGNGALSAKAFDDAVRDYVSALKTNPSHAGAKRNLEIALARREAAQKAASGGQKNQQGNKQQQQQQKQQKPAPGARQQKEGQADLDALLRSVQQQEQEELRRMKGRAAEGKVGW